jgi:hypothetical protein
LGARKPAALKQDRKNRQMLMFVCLMMRNATFNNVLSLLMEETGEHGENHRSFASH